VVPPADVGALIVVIYILFAKASPINREAPLTIKSLS